LDKNGLTVNVLLHAYKLNFTEMVMMMVMMMVMG